MSVLFVPKLSSLKFEFVSPVVDCKSCDLVTITVSILIVYISTLSLIFLHTHCDDDVITKRLVN